jgi:hypothetical protein
LRKKIIRPALHARINFIGSTILEKRGECNQEKVLREENFRGTAAKCNTPWFGLQQYVSIHNYNVI